MSVINEVAAAVRRYFVSGVLVVVPLILTYIVLKFLFESVDSVLQPLLQKALGYSIYGLGVFTTILLIILAGVLTRNFVGAQLYRVGDRIMSAMPIIRPIYSATKQLLEAVAMPSMNAFKEVALVEYPRRGVWSLGFISNRMDMIIDGSRKTYIAVFIPSTPTPISGMVIMVSEEEAIVVDMTVEEGVKYLVSGGVASPELIRKKNKSALDNDKEVGSETR